MLLERTKILLKEDGKIYHVKDVKFDLNDLGKGEVVINKDERLYIYDFTEMNFIFCLGLQDKNGVFMYHEDVIEYRRNTESQGVPLRTGNVLWNYNEFRWEIHNEDSNNIVTPQDIKDAEIVSNNIDPDNWMDWR